MVSIELDSTRARNKKISLGGYQNRPGSFLRVQSKKHSETHNLFIRILNWMICISFLVGSMRGIQQCNPLFEKVEKTGLTGFGKRLSLLLNQPLQILFFSLNETIHVCFSIVLARGRVMPFFSKCQNRLSLFLLEIL